MIKVVLDTNILVSALLTKTGNPARILDMTLDGFLCPCFDNLIMSEYLEVLSKPKFNFPNEEIKIVLDFILYEGLLISPIPLEWTYPDITDRKFYEVSVAAQAYLITGNLKHFPKHRTIVNPQSFLELLEKTNYN